MSCQANETRLGRERDLSTVAEVVLLSRVPCMSSPASESAMKCPTCFSLHCSATMTAGGFAIEMM